MRPLPNILKAARLVPLAATLAAGLATSSCETVNDDRIPYVAVRITFNSQGDWNTYGVGGSLDTRRFIIQDNQPAGFPYSAMSATGYGGVLLVSDYDGELRAFDLACPVEVRPTVRINVITDDGEPRGECPVCHSTYDIFRYGGPLSGPAAKHGYGLTHYFVGPGLSGAYMAITH